jgi:hypothetical protein
MPGSILTVGSVILCAHGGTVQSPSPFPRVKIDGQPVLLQTIPLTVAGCTFPPPPAGNGPCVTATALMGSVRVRANSMPLLLQSSPALCTPTGTPISVAFAQVRVRAQ